MYNAVKLKVWTRVRWRTTERVRHAVFVVVPMSAVMAKRRVEAACST